MTDKTNPGILDYLVLLVKWKRLFLVLMAGVFVFSYLAIYFFVDVEYEATATIMPTEEKQLGGVSALMKNLGNIPLALGGGTKNADMDLYTTILGSRPLLEKVITNFDLLKDYHVNSMEKAVMVLRKKIKGHVTDENAYEIVVRANSAQKSADIASYVLDILNKTVIEFEVAKSRNNRIFLEQRYKEMNENLRIAEDSLQYYQEKTGMFEAQEQTKMIITAYSSIEAELITKQIELSILENTLSKESPELERVRMEVKEYGLKLENMKSEGDKNGVILALNSLPQAGKNYVRHYRDVRIYSSILEFLVPLYEQARFDEQKDVPVIQVIENPVAPEKKVFPPRVVFSLLITLGSVIVGFFYVLIQENDNWKKSEKLIYIRTNLGKWKREK